MCNRSPQPKTNTHVTLPHTHSLIYQILHTVMIDSHKQALMYKHMKYDPLINTLHNNGWKSNALVTITTEVRGAIHKHSIDNLTKLKIPKINIKTLMKSIHQNAIKYLTYIVMNK